MSVDPRDPEIMKLLVDSRKSNNKDLIDRYQSYRHELCEEAKESLRYGLSTFFSLYGDLVEAVNWRWYFYNDYDDSSYSSGVRANGPYIVFKEDVWKDCYTRYQPKDYYGNVLDFDSWMNHTEEGDMPRGSLDCEVDVDADWFSSEDSAKFNEICNEANALFGNIIQNFVTDWLDTVGTFTANRAITVTPDGQWAEEEYYYESY